MSAMTASVSTNADMADIIEFGPRSIRYDPAKGIVIAPTLMALRAAINEAPLGYQGLLLGINQTHEVKAALVGRKHVMLADDGLSEWRLTVEGMLKEVNAEIEYPPARLEILRCDQVVPVPINWLWQDWLACGKLHILAGAPGTGKTTLALALASCLSIGGHWPDGFQAVKSQILIWSGEDSCEDTIVPRLEAMGADRKQIHFINGVEDHCGKRSFDPAHDIAILADAMQRIRPALLIVDPIISAVAGDSHKNAETRRSLQPLVDLASGLGIAVLGISHFSKGTAGRDPTERVTGSLAFGALARVVMAAAKLPDDAGGGRIFCRAKSNIGPDKGGFKYDLELAPVSSGQMISRVVWGQAVHEGARELLAEADASDTEAVSERTAAKEFLEAELASGPVSAKHIKSSAEQAGHSWATVRRAKDALGIITEKVGMEAGWQWRLPSKMLNPPEDAHQKGVSIFGMSEHLREPESIWQAEF